MTAPLWAITSYFNPAGYRRRLANFRVFRQHLSLPLLAIEWSPDGRFTLGPQDADRLLQVAGGDVMWQKERLLNLAIAELPGHVTHVAWIDCDVVFEAPLRADALMERLGRAELVQLFERVVHLAPAPIESLASSQQWRRQPVLHARAGIAWTWTRQGGRDAQSLLSAPPDRPFTSPASTGHAWAASRALLERAPLLEAWILGGGETAYLHAALGLAAQHARVRGLTEAHARHYLAAAERLHGDVDGRISSHAGTLLHLWHGDAADRRYQERFRILERHGFDPSADIALDDAAAVWRWTGRSPALAAEVRGYFASRHEDGR